METDPIIVDEEPHFGPDLTLKRKLWLEYGRTYLLLYPGLILAVAVANYPFYNDLIGVSMLVGLAGFVYSWTVIEKWSKNYYQLGDEFLLVITENSSFSIWRSDIQEVIVETTGRGQVQKIRLKIPDQKIVIEAQQNFNHVALQFLAWYDNPGRVHYHRDWRPEFLWQRLILNLLVLFIFSYLATIFSWFGVAIALLVLALFIGLSKLAGYLQPGRGTFAIGALVITALISNQIHWASTGYWGWQYPCGFIAQTTGFDYGCTKVFYGSKLGGFTADSQAIMYASTDLFMVEPLFGPLTNLRTILFPDLGFLEGAQSLNNGEVHALFSKLPWVYKLTWRPGETPVEVAKHPFSLPEFSINRSLAEGNWYIYDGNDTTNGLYHITPSGVQFTLIKDMGTAIFSPDNQWVAIQHNDLSLSLHRLQENLPQQPLLNTIEVRCLAFAPDQPWLVGYNRQNKFVIWDVNTQEIIFEQPISLLSPRPTLYLPCFLQFLPGRDTLLLLAEGEKFNTHVLWVIPILSGQPARSIPIPYSEQIALSPDGQWLALKLNYRDQIWLINVEELLAEPQE